MADNYEHPGHDESSGGSPPEGDFPADFFDDAADPSPASPPHEPLPELPHEPPAVPKRAEPLPAGSEGVAPPPVTGPPSSHKAPAAAPVDDERVKRSVFPFVLGALLAGVLGTAWYITNKPKEATPVTTTTPAPAPGAVEPAPAPARSEHVEALEGKVKDLTSKVDELAAGIKGFEAKLNDLPKPEPAPDLKPLEGKINDLSKSIAGVAPL
ncbi:MAG: hypothetical protein LC745_11280, partial [Planctomycetia bacterium]|nr:hypothetical protein [Planctomycetia bacterium]